MASACAKLLFHSEYFLTDDEIVGVVDLTPEVGESRGIVHFPEEREFLGTDEAHRPDEVPEPGHHAADRRPGYFGRIGISRPGDCVAAKIQIHFVLFKIQEYLLNLNLLCTKRVIFEQSHDMEKK